MVLQARISDPCTGKTLKEKNYQEKTLLEGDEVLTDCFQGMMSSQIYMLLKCGEGILMEDTHRD